MTASSPNPDASHDDVVDWADLGQKLWSFLAGREAAVDYRLIDLRVEVPRDTGTNAPRATWMLNGSLQVTTDDTTSVTDRSPRSA